MGILERNEAVRRGRVDRARELVQAWPHTFGADDLRDRLVHEKLDDPRTLPQLAIDLLPAVEMSDGYETKKTHDSVDDPQPTNFTIYSDLGVPNPFKRASSASPEMWVYSVENGLAAGSARSEVVLDGEGRYVPYVTRAPYLAPLFHGIEATKLPGTALMVRTPGAVMFSHWLYDLLPRVEAARVAGFGPDEVDHVLVNGQKFGYEFETLRALGYRDEQIIHVDGASGPVHADRLIVPTYPRATEKSKYTPDWARAMVRRIFDIEGDPKRKPARPKVAYLSRQKAYRRRIVPHDQLDDFLGGVDAIWLEPEKSTVREVAHQLSDVALFLGPHGAGLANGVFLPSWAGAIEIIGAQFMLEHFHVLTSSTSHYVGVTASDEGDDVFTDAAIGRMRSRTNTQNQELDIYLDRDRTAQALAWADAFLDRY